MYRKEAFLLPVPSGVGLAKGDSLAGEEENNMPRKTQAAS